MKLNCLIIDDEPLARKGLAEYVKEIEFLHGVGECGSAAEAASLLTQHSVDLLLLDIQMPRLTGIDFLKTLTHPPMAIITTAYSEYALEGYSLDVIDYLVKPIPFDRFLKAVQKAFDFHSMRRKETTSAAPDYFFVKSNGKYEKVVFSEILFVESMQNYVIIHLQAQKLIVYMTLAGLEAQLPPKKFMKVHKSFVVAIGQVTSIENNEIIIKNTRVPISRTLKDEVMRRILGDNLLSR